MTRHWSITCHVNTLGEWLSTVCCCSICCCFRCFPVFPYCIVRLFLSEISLMFYGSRLLDLIPTCSYPSGVICSINIPTLLSLSSFFFFVMFFFFTCFAACRWSGCRRQHLIILLISFSLSLTLRHDNDCVGWFSCKYFPVVGLVWNL